MKFLNEELNINLYIKNILTNEKVDTSTEVESVNNDLDLIENNINLIKSKSFKITSPE